RGLPTGRKGAEIPRPMRVAQVSQELEVLARIEGIDQALTVVRRRRGKAYDPDLADLVLAEAPGWWDQVEPADPWDTALDLAPACSPLTDEQTHESLLALADFSALNAPLLGGHSRGVAELVRDACGPSAETAALVHDLGRVAI